MSSLRRHKCSYKQSMSLLRSSSVINNRVVPPWVVSYSTGLGGGGNLETRPPEPPFLNINVNSPIVRSWNGWDFVINRPDIATPTLSNRLRTYKLRFTSHSEKEKAPPISSRTSDIDKATPAQISFILLKLRDEIPQFFTGCHSYSILYEKDMTFENKIGLLKCSLKSRLSYKMYLNSLRHGLCSIYSNVNCDLIKITKDITSSKIEARWRITGKPSLIPSSNTRVLVEGFSTFTVNQNGLISNHLMDKMIPSSRDKTWRLSWLTQLMRGSNLKPVTHSTSYQHKLT